MSPDCNSYRWVDRIHCRVHVWLFYSLLSVDFFLISALLFSSHMVSQHPSKTSLLRPPVHVCSPFFAAVLPINVWSRHDSNQGLYVFLCMTISKFKIQSISHVNTIPNCFCIQNWHSVLFWAIRLSSHGLVYKTQDWNRSASYLLFGMQTLVCCYE